MTQPTIAQLYNLADRAARGPLTPDEVARLREGINQLAAHGTQAPAPGQPTPRDDDPEEWEECDPETAHAFWAALAHHTATRSEPT